MLSPVLFVYTICNATSQLYFVHPDILGESIDCHIDVQCILKATQLKKNNRKCPWNVGLQSAMKHSFRIAGKNIRSSYLPMYFYNNFSFLFFFARKQHPFIISVGGILKSACVFLEGAAHNSSREAVSCSVMALVYFWALSLVTFHSSLMQCSSVEGNIYTTTHDWFYQVWSVKYSKWCSQIQNIASFLKLEMILCCVNVATKSYFERICECSQKHELKRRTQRPH